MTTFIPFSGCAQANLQMTVDTIPAELTLGFRYVAGGALDAAALASLGGALHDWVFTDLKGALSSDVDFLNWHLVDLDALDGFVVDTPLGFTGTGAASAVPNNVALTVTFITALRGRSYRGRNYVPGIPEGGLLNKHQWSDALMSGMNDVYGSLAGHVTTVSWEHVVLSRWLDKSPRSLGHAEPVLAYRSNKPIYTQRRRLR